MYPMMPQQMMPPMMAPFYPQVAEYHNRGFFPYSQYHPMMGVVPQPQGIGPVKPTTALFGVLALWWMLTKDD